MNRMICHHGFINTTDILLHCSVPGPFLNVVERNYGNGRQNTYHDNYNQQLDDSETKIFIVCPPFH